ncbi:FadR/GntR family transcriptional regulator [Nosocomiicoccus sp. HMSC09A07]|uniref:FadR/GntR family transcriptional regulator n=1 Tax=Nosocomiicoccus sp. HMSC09A07 TaxID=1581145 RepID=UPI0008A1D5F4|nr:FadR/GntR family transcriptional regulator [Nosocomiicoccus sp. HMSC09A07]OFS62752.1 hypothetical protein HMPREF3177_04735 [Nosocomiicoccus sp. HMSC09A07]
MTQVDKVYNHLLEHIERGAYQLNDKLPSQYALSKQYDVSRATIREALTRLESLNYIVTHQGQGSFVINTSIAPLLSKHAYEEFDERQLYDLLEIRTIIEVEAAALSARRRTTDDLKNIKDALNHFENITINDEDVGVEADYKFHEAIIISTKNEYLIQTFRNFKEIHVKALTYSLKMNLNRPRKRQSVYNEHRDIYNSIFNQDEERASAYMKQHLETMRLKLGDPRVE